ncbi:50S ribosomal protein L25/general stress protein Ctc [Aquibacillus koreensis]|uniref:Large ribosomal subunit protein bL25 n=1 Tax=Aquibacillus koreensis TaxID=279446 RepID=A0A9X3WQF5_9BACI|nr:50S ribosomal protein L25/general stress protein Ctc [Aquibacillus koreensis]MCT2534314.1 50S ribosomal protein L25/general stress protein Ctc [Aquibacillus koreensis]MDC3422391.1 50S ribosomal protein L25/general stress protein Ctc [Aquibacillus koreensis]
MAIKLKADERSDLKRSNTKKIRQAGNIPAVVYGNNKKVKTISVNSIDLLKTVRDEGKNAIISLEVGGESVDVMLHEYQTEPLRDELVHADFYVVNMSQEMDVQVTIHLDGESPGVNDGGVLQQPLHELSVRAKPGDIPEEIKVDISKLDVGDSITVSDLKSGSKYEILEDEETTIVTILAPDRGTTEDEEGEEEEQAEEVQKENEEEQKAE